MHGRSIRYRLSTLGIRQEALITRSVFIEYERHQTNPAWSSVARLLLGYEFLQLENGLENLRPETTALAL